MLVFIGMLAGGAVLLMIYISSSTQNPTNISSASVPSVSGKMGQANETVSQKLVSTDSNHSNSSDSKHQNAPDLVPSPLEEEAKTAAIIQYADAKLLTRNDSPFAIQWLSDSEANRMHVKDLLSKAKVKSKESFTPSPVRTKQEASDHLNVSISFADFPSKAFESSDYFFFSAPLTQNFNKGFAIKKETGEIFTW